MLGLYDYQRRPERLADRLPWYAMVAEAPCVVRHKDGSLQHCLRFTGYDTDALGIGELQGYAALHNNVFRRLGSGWAVFVEYGKRQVREYPEATWPNAASAAADAERREYFLRGNHYRPSSVLSLVWRPQSVTEARLSRWVMRGQGPAQQTPAADVIATFQDQVQRFTSLVAGCVEEVEPLGPQGTLTYLHSTVSTTAHPVAVPEIPAHLDSHLTDRDFVPGMHPALILGAKAVPTGRRWQDRFDAQHLRTLTITGFPDETYPEMLAALQQLPLEYRYVERWLPMDAAEAQAVLRKQMSYWDQAKYTTGQLMLGEVLPSAKAQMNPDTGAQLKQDSVKEALRDAHSDIVTFGYFTATVTVWDASDRQADAKLREVERVITGRGFTCKVEHLNATEAWLGSLPGHCYPNVRRPILRSTNLVHMFLGGIYTGPPQDTHLRAAPLLTAVTAGNVPYSLVLHEEGVGHALIIGPSGAGKTTLVGAMGLQFQRYHTLGANVRLIDKNEGLKPVTQAVGGDHYTLSGTASGMAFQPLREIDDLAERQWAASWTESLAAVQHITCTPAERGELLNALGAVAALPPEQRTLTALYYLVQDTRLRQVLYPYTAGQPYGEVLDAVAEPVVLREWTCFETDALFRVPLLVGPVLGVLFHQLQRTFHRRLPTLFGLDEAWKYLDQMVFLGQIDEWLRELRKLEVSMLLSTQDLNELLTSPISTVLLNNCPIRILLPNKRAREGLLPDGQVVPGSIAESYRRVGLNDRQIELLSFAMPHKEYMVLTRGGCRMIDLALGPVQLGILREGKLP